MPYERSFDIKQRLSAALALIRTGRYSTPMLAESLGVSIPTVSRSVLALRERGHDIQVVKSGKVWRYVLGTKSKQTISRMTKPREDPRASMLAG